MWPLLLALSSLVPVSFSNTNATWELPTPTNVSIDSYNMKHIMKWNPVQVPNALLPVMYRVECDLRRNPESIPICVNITETQCDFRDKIQPLWRPICKVRAELGQWRSAWAEGPEFQANMHTKIGPVTSLVLESQGDSITVDFLPPFPPFSEKFRFKYRLYYWKENAENEKAEVPLALTHYMLANLEELTVYCVQVKAHTASTEGQTSEPKCAKTTTREYNGKELAVIVTCVFIVCAICSVTGYIIYRNHDLLKRFLYPPFRIPYHIQEFIDNPPEQPYEAASDHSHTEEDYDHISVVESTFIPEVDQICAGPNLVPVEKT